MRRLLRPRPPRWPKAVPPPERPAPGKRVEAGPRVWWIHHHTVLLQWAGTNLLLNPHWSGRLGPGRWRGPKRVGPPVWRWQDLPAVDAVLVTGDDPGRLDPLTLLAWRERTELFIDATDGRRWPSALRHHRRDLARGPVMCGKLRLAAEGAPPVGNAIVTIRFGDRTVHVLSGAAIREPVPPVIQPGALLIAAWLETRVSREFANVAEAARTLARFHRAAGAAATLAVGHDTFPLVPAPFGAARRALESAAESESLPKDRLPAVRFGGFLEMDPSASTDLAE